jgi:hypothetical protein
MLPFPAFNSVYCIVFPEIRNTTLPPSTVRSPRGFRHLTSHRAGREAIALLYIIKVTYYAYSMCAGIAAL